MNGYFSHRDVIGRERQRKTSEINNNVDIVLSTHNKKNMVRDRDRKKQTDEQRNRVREMKISHSLHQFLFWLDELVVL